MSRNGVLLFIFCAYISLALILSLLIVKPVFYGLSTILGTTVLGTTVLGTTVLGTTIMGTTVLGSTLLGTTSLVEVYAEALSLGQLAITVLGIGMLLYLELSDPSTGKYPRVVAELRKSWLPLTTLLVLLFTVIVFFRVWNILA